MRSDLQIALLPGFHIIWTVLSIDLSLLLMVVKVCWFKTGDPVRGLLIPADTSQLAILAPMS
jgi:cytochrome bd-type quinol oxidase subunit 1